MGGGGTCSEGRAKNNIPFRLGGTSMTFWARGLFEAESGFFFFFWEVAFFGEVATPVINK